MTHDPSWSGRLLDVGLAATLAAWAHLPPAPWGVLVAWVGLPAWLMVGRPSWRGLRGFYLTAALGLHAVGLTAWWAATRMGWLS